MAFGAGVVLVLTATSYAQQAPIPGGSRGGANDLISRVGNVAYALTGARTPQPFVFGMLGPNDAKPLDPERQSTSIWGEYSQGPNGETKVEIYGQLSGNRFLLCSAERTFSQ